MPDYGASELGGAAAETGAATAGETAAATAGETAAADTAAAAGTDLGATAGTGGTLAGGTGEFATGVTAADLASTGAGTGAALTAPSFFDQLTSAYNTVSPYINTASKVLQTGNMIKNAVSGAGTPQTGAANTPSTAPYATSPQPATPTGSQTNQQDYINQQTAYWQQLLSATGSSLAQRPDIQDMIRRQSSLYPA